MTNKCVLRMRLLEVMIHVGHFSWMAVLVSAIDEAGNFSGNWLFLLILLVSFFLEMWRWILLGKERIEIKGAYSLATTLEAANRDFLQFSWYVIPPVPPRKLLDEYSSSGHDFPQTMQVDQVLARFYLKSRVTFPLIGCGIAVLLVLYPGAAPILWGLGKIVVVAHVIWIAAIGLLSKIVAIFSFSLIVGLTKGLRQ